MEMASRVAGAKEVAMEESRAAADLESEAMANSMAGAKDVAMAAARAVADLESAAMAAAMAREVAVGATEEGVTVTVEATGCRSA